MKKLLAFLGFLLIWAVLYEVFATAMYTRSLVRFYDIEKWSFNENGFIFNGRASVMGNLISVIDLATTVPESGTGTVPEWCPGVEPVTRSNVTIGVIEGNSVCCEVEDGQWLVPYVDKDGHRHYLCGKWPRLDEVRKPLF